MVALAGDDCCVSPDRVVVIERHAAAGEVDAVYDLAGGVDGEAKGGLELDAA